MSLSGKAALAMVAPAAAAMIVTGTGTANAAGDLYGAMAVSYTYYSVPLGAADSYATGVGVAVDFPSQAAADQAAIDACDADRCFVLARAHNECASVVEYDTWAAWSNAVEPVYHTGVGPTAAAAEQAAMAKGNAGLGFPTSMFFTLGLARIVKPLFVLDTICTANVR
ncbi:DUF4189 domain-containing protein [Nocardia uniformis]|uniref:DUF4189 domain-containing protein n=1 Tax=Nocardia uniformis TaxID=53432 RepID=A0A849C387_9NOCA|nr:DUF4189 domain-containing protein [Nocardia uniformis]NNH73132.1 DUF4189 domain-containing protein [Nocardia uniformis]